MGFSLTPVDESVEEIRVNFWNWRPTVGLIGTFEIIDAERLELLPIECSNAEISASEAIQIADRMENGVLSVLPPEGRVNLDLSVTTAPDDFLVHQGKDTHKNYGATENWLRQFVLFCRTSNGFFVF